MRTGWGASVGAGSVAAGEGRFSGQMREKRPSGAKALIDSIGLMPGINPRPAVRRGFSAACLVVLALTAQGQSGPAVRVDYSNPSLTPPRWTLTLHPDGSGHFQSERGDSAAGSLETADPPQLEAPSQDREIRVSAAFAGRVFETARTHKWFNEECESHMKVAFQGWKKLSYAGPEGQGSCEFNYSKDNEVQALGDSLVAVAGTILEGAKLETLLLHDRLGLDREMEYLVEASGDGRVQQIGAIRGILERLADDPGVLERVRKRARALLAKAER